MSSMLRPLRKPRRDDRAPIQPPGAARAAACTAGAPGDRSVLVAAGGAGGLEEGDGEERALAAAARPGAHLRGKAPPEAAVAGLRVVFEVRDGVGVLMAERVDRLRIAADVAAEADAVALLVAVAGAEVGDLEAYLDAVAESEPLEVEGDGVRVEGKCLAGGHTSKCRTRRGG
jgi:hypothetical protein